MAIDKKKYEFGRHETFGLRDGWLSRGSARLVEGNFKVDVDTADALGLGRNMVKSLSFWLEASGLALRSEGKGAGLSPTEFASLQKTLDPYFEYALSTWLVHLFLSRREATVWNWFFNDFRSGTFDREDSIEAFHRHVRQNAPNQTTPTVLAREIACLLDTYATAPANEAIDPEDNRISPLRSLRLLVKHHDTGRYEKASPIDRIPVEAFLACVRLVCDDIQSPSIPLSDLISRRDSPARLFNIDGDTINALAHQAEEIYSNEGVRLTLLGSTRTFTVPDITPLEWYVRHFDRIARR